MSLSFKWNLNFAAICRKGPERRSGDQKKNRNGVPVRSGSKRTLDVSGASINYCVSSTCFKSASGSSVVFAVRTFSISPLTYLRKISLRTTANIGETENQRVSVERLQ